MRISLLVFLALAFASCSSGPKNTIEVFNNIKFNLEAGEEVAVIDSRVKKTYTEHFNYSISSIPLFRYIKHKDYAIYIGIPFDASIASLVADTMMRTGSEIIESEEKAESYYKKYRKGETYITEYAADIKGESLVFFASMTDSKEISEKFFNRTTLPKRLIQN